MERITTEAKFGGGDLENLEKSLNLRISSELVKKLAALGVEQVVVCAGSRNAPLFFAIQSSRQFSIFHHVDERGAGFFAVGLAMTSHKPVAVVTTSGTAAAELLPSCIEAFYQRLPLILVTADRLPSYRGTAAPQAIEQLGLFSDYATTVDVTTENEIKDVNGLGDKGVLHLNICLEEPAFGDWSVDPFEKIERQKEVREPPRSSSFQGLKNFFHEGKNVIALVGDIPRAEAKYVESFLTRLGIPVAADTTSNLNFKVLRCADKVLHSSPPTHVLRIGSIPSFRFWRDLENKTTPVFNLSTRAFTGLSRETQNLQLSSYAELDGCDATSQSGQLEYKNLVQAQDDEFNLQIETLFDRYPLCELSFLKKLNSVIVKEAALYLGNSLPIREWNLCNGMHSPTYANRGANGIDGQVASYLGVAQSFAESWAVIGDQTALYDLNALAIASENPKGVQKKRIVVINNRGGKIFSHLNYSAQLDSVQRKLIENSHRFEFKAWAEMFAWGYESWDGNFSKIDSNIDELILEIFPDATQTHHFWSDWRALRK